ncbi:MAG: YggS family pyridoxal phosphate-dependent enzyme [Armatimonadota bacterium]|nr:YggS family pyridoxal phosphate-dependent enzyme [Armatimonadota bacterium]MDW8156945.1 YggS family pyridoxal phosphate-dependent enzyme [Armatimonadota bacterium]
MTPAGLVEQAVRERLGRVRERIRAACERAGRDPQEVRVVAVTKGFGAEVAAAAVRAGLRELGENRVQEAREKVPRVQELVGPEQVTWHLVGHLQRNKARWAAELFAWVHSVDSPELAHELSRRATAAGRTVQVLVEVNVAGEATKHGTTPERARAMAELVACLPHLRLVGLMTVAPQAQDPEQVRWVFRALRELRDRIRTDCGLELAELSMGMTDDFEVAVEEGATLVRLGRALFGDRPTVALARTDLPGGFPGPAGRGTTQQRG